MFLSKFATVVVLAVLSNWFYKRWHFLKFYNHHHTQLPGDCRAIPGIVDGSEDAELVEEDLLLITSGLHLFSESRASLIGKIFLFDFNAPDQAHEVEIKWKTDDKKQKFNPHGLSVWHKSQDPTVMVISHEPDGEVVEIFVFKSTSKTLVHEESVILENKGIINDVKATGPRSFYYTVTFYFRGILAKVEYLMGRFSGSVEHYDGDSIKVLLSGLGMANGIEMSSDGRYVYVSEGLTDSILVYARQENNDLHFIKRQSVASLPDNLSFDSSSNILVGSTATIGRLMLAGKPHSQVLKLEVKDGIPTGKIWQLFSGNGEILGLSSIGIYHKSRLFVGSVEDKAMICDVKYYPQ